MEKNSTLFFKNDFEILNLLKGNDINYHSFINFDEQIKITPQDLLKNENTLYFEYKNIDNLNKLIILNQETIIKTSQNLFIYFNIFNQETKIKIFYKPENINDLNLFIMGLKKIAKNNENK